MFYFKPTQMRLEWQLKRCRFFDRCSCASVYKCEGFHNHLKFVKFHRDRFDDVEHWAWLAMYLFLDRRNTTC